MTVLFAQLSGLRPVYSQDVFATSVIFSQPSELLPIDHVSKCLLALVACFLDSIRNVPAFF